MVQHNSGSLLTPPSSANKTAKFMEPIRGLRYFEDFQGINEDEELERFPDECEESDSSESIESPYGSGERVSSKFTSLMQRQPSRERNAVSSRHFGKIDKAKGVRYKIVPSINPRQSIQANEGGRQEPKGYGMLFSPSPEMETSNSAGEMMDDMFRAGYSAAFGNLEVGSPMPEDVENARMAENADLSVINKWIGQPMAEHETEGATNAVKAPKTADVTQAVVNKESIPRVKKPGNGAAPRNSRFERPPAPSTGRYSTRHQEKITEAKQEAEKIANRRTTRSNANRTTTVQMKETEQKKRKVGRPKKRTKANGQQKGIAQLSQASGKSNKKGSSATDRGRSKVTARSWKDTEIQPHCGYVVVETGRVDPNEYIRYY